MAVEYTRVTVVIISVLLISWGSFANFNPAFAVTAEDNLRALIDGISIDIAIHSGTPLGDELEDARDEFQDALDELKEDPPDVDAAIKSISKAQKEIQKAIDDEGYSSILGNTLINALEAIKDKLEKDEKKISVCHIPPGNPAGTHRISISKNALTAHFAHGDYVGTDCVKDKDEQDELRKNLKKEKDTKKFQLKKKQNELKDDIKKLLDLNKDFQENKEEFKIALKEKKDEIKELLKDLRNNYAFELELKKDLKKDLKITKHKIIQDLKKHEKFTKHKVDSKISALSKSSDPDRDAKKFGLDFKNGKTKIVIKLSTLDPQVLEELQSLGTITAKNGKHIQLVTDLDNIQKIGLLDGVDKIRPPFSAIQFEQQISEGVYFINADLVHYKGITGKGVKVAVLDFAFTNNEKISDNIVEVKSFRQGLGYVPIQGFEHEASHGTAVAEIITDVAPDVELYLYAMETDIEFAEAVDEAISQGVDIIAMSAGWPHFPTDGSSHITKKIEQAIENDIVFVVPSGNFGDKHWEGTYNDSNLNGWHEFTTLDEGLSFNVTLNRILEEKPIIANLIWDVGLGDVADFDLVLVDPLGQIVDYSANEQSTKNDTPLEYIHHIPDTQGIYALGIIHNGENNSPAEIPDAMIEIFTPSDELEYPVPQGSVSVPSDAAGAIVVGAVNHMSGELEPFSSQGPTNHGKLAPHLVGPDGVTTTALDGEPFFGTSATAPYIAGMVALLLETNPDISSDQILTKLQQNTAPSLFSAQTDYDNLIGYGPANALFLTLEEVVG